MNDYDNLMKRREELEKIVKFGESVHKLCESKEFSEVIVKEFCTNYVANQASNMGDSRLDANQKESSRIAAMAGGVLKRWLTNRLSDLEVAKKEIKDIDDLISDTDLEDYN